MNSKKHEEFTGRGNELMLENAKKIAASGMTELSIRIPVIPGFNDTPEEIRDIAVFTRELGHVKRLHLRCNKSIRYRIGGADRRE